MNKTEPPVWNLLLFYGLFGGSIFVAGVSFLGFLGWLSDPSSQKWAALAGCIIGSASAIYLWGTQDQFLAPAVETADEKIKLLSIKAQHLYWNAARRSAIVLGLVWCGGVLILGMVTNHLDRAWLSVALIALYGLGRVFRAMRELRKLPLD